MVRSKKTLERIIYQNGFDNENCDPDYVSCQNGECDCDEIFLEDEKINLNIPLDGEVIAIAQLGLWNGRRQGYKILRRNVNSIFNIMQDYNKFYTDGKNILSEQIHHDGRNYILYRELRTDRSQESIEKFLNAIYNGQEVTPQLLSAYTRSLHPYVAKVYGW